MGFAEQLHIWLRKCCDNRYLKPIFKKSLGWSARRQLRKHPVPEKVAIDVDDLQDFDLPKFAILWKGGGVGGTFAVRHKKRGRVIVAWVGTAKQLQSKFNSKDFEVVKPNAELQHTSQYVCTGCSGGSTAWKQVLDRHPMAWDDPHHWVQTSKLVEEEQERENA